jgi:predicted ArsR family transcriptional regulator
MNGGFLPMLRSAGATLGAAVDQDAKKGGPEAAKRFLESLGAPVDLDQTNGARLSVNCCPLAAVTRNMPELCNMMAAALETTSGMSASVHCTHGAHPRCAFEMTTPLS